MNNTQIKKKVLKFKVTQMKYSDTIVRFEATVSESLQVALNIVAN